MAIACISVTELGYLLKCLNMVTCMESLQMIWICKGFIGKLQLIANK
jgi:hypothetical protein